MSQVRSKDIILLHFLAEYRVLTIQQIAAVFEITPRAARKRIDKLHSEKLISVMPMNFNQGKGRPENLITIKKAGIKVLYEKKIIDQKITPERIIFEDYSRITHELYVNWFRIHLNYLEKQLSDINTDFISATTPFLRLRKDGSPIISDSVTIKDKKRTFIPDGVFSIAHSEQHKQLLFFLEIDMGTESITNSTGKSDTIQQKVTNYHTYFLNEGYKRYQKKWKCELNGFRVLFVTNNNQQKERISRFLRESKSNDFVWVTSQKQLFQHGLSCNIWSRDGNNIPQQSILGPTLAQDLPLPNFYR